jgi:CRP-like cAMP-binding protein
MSDVDWAPLRGLTEAEVDEVLGLGRFRRFGRREVIWHEGDRADTFHIIRSGWIAVQRTTALGEVATVAVWGPGQAAGLIDAARWSSRSPRRIWRRSWVSRGRR